VTRSYQFLLDYFHATELGQLRWAHRVNSSARLTTTLQISKINIVEGDVSLDTSHNLIMAHPPKRESDLTFTEWITKLIAAKRGIKIDLKSPQALEGVIARLTSWGSFSNPLFINADLCQGPGGRTPLFNTKEFFSQIAKLKGLSLVVSVGWTTSFSPSYSYTKQMIDEMINLTSHYKGAISYCIRSSYYFKQVKMINSLIREKNHSLTFWNNEKLTPQVIKALVKFSNRKRCFYDLINSRMQPVDIFPPEYYTTV